MLSIRSQAMFSLGRTAVRSNNVLLANVRLSLLTKRSFGASTSLSSFGSRDGPRDGNQARGGYRGGNRDGYRDGNRGGFRGGYRDGPRDGPRFVRNGGNQGRGRGFAPRNKYQSGEAYEAAKRSDFAENMMDVDPKITKFVDLAEAGLISDNVIRTVTDGMGHLTMTPVQAKTVDAILQGRDIVAQAKTGTGKTLGFLLPVVERILRSDPSLSQRKLSRRQGVWNNSQPSNIDIRSIIISPTRELAEQIAVEARKITSQTGIMVQTAVGGTGKRAALQQMYRSGCHILVGTPGRLQDLLSDPTSGVTAPKLNSLVLDEGDRLLDQGFSQDIKAICELLPDRAEVDRQTLIFSATIPRGVLQLVRDTLKPDFGFVQTVPPDEPATHEKITQHVVGLRGLENALPTVIELAKRQLAKGSFKAIIYMNASSEVELNGEILRRLRKTDGKSPIAPVRVFHIAGSMSQNARTIAANSFRDSESAILVSTDVTARGMHFPGVTHVIQVGAPPSGEQYVHRLGRTGRGDASGEGWLLVTDSEMMTAHKMLRGYPIVQDTSLEAPDYDMADRSTQPSEAFRETIDEIARAVDRVHYSLKADFYQAALRAKRDRMNQEELTDMMKRYAEFGLGMPVPPSPSDRRPPVREFERERRFAPSGPQMRYNRDSRDNRGGFASRFSN